MSEESPLVPRRAHHSESPTFSLPHYIFGGLLVVLYAVALSFNLNSFWSLLAVALTTALFVEVFWKRIYVHKPDNIAVSTLATQALYGGTLAPLALFLIGLTIVILCLFVLLIFLLMFYAFYTIFYSHATTILVDYLVDLSNSRAVRIITHTAARVAPTFLALSRLSTGMRQTEVGEPSPLDPWALWDKMIAAGVPSFVLILTIIFFFVLLVFLSLVAGLLYSCGMEYVKWQLFIRYRKFELVDDENDDDDDEDADEEARHASKAKKLGVTGLVMTALTGMAGLVFISLIENMFALSQSYGSFFDAIVFTAAAILDAVTLAGSQLLVATGYAERTVLGKETRMRMIWRLSIMYFFSLSLLKTSPVPREVSDEGTSVLGWLFITGLRAYLAYTFTLDFLVRYELAREEERESA